MKISVRRLVWALAPVPAVLVILALSGCAVLGRGDQGGGATLVVKGVEYPLERRLGADSVVVDGVVYRVASRLAADSVLWIHTRVLASNVTEDTVAPKYSACHPVARIYLSLDRSGIPVWDETKSIESPVGCKEKTSRLRLAPGRSRQLHMVAVAPRRLNASLPPGRYYLSVIFWVGGQAYELASGEGEIES